MKTPSSDLQYKLSPHVRGGIYYAVHFIIVSIYFSYTNVAYIERGITGTQLGILSAVGSIVSLIASPLLTSIIDRKNWHLQAIIYGNLIFGLSVLGINFVFTSFPLLLLVTSVGGFFKAPANPVGDGLVIRMANKYNINFGQMRVWGSISFTVFCLLAGKLWDIIGIEWVFWVGGFLFVLRTAMGFLLDPPEKKPEDAQKAAKVKRHWFAPLKDRTFLLYLIAIVFWGCAQSGFGGYISIYMNQLTGSTTLVGIAIALPAIAEIPSVFWGERFIRRFGMLPMTVAAIVATSIISLAVAFIHDPTLIIILNAIRGLGFGLYIVAGVRYVDSRAPSDQIGTYQSLSGMAGYTIPALVFMPLLGYLYDTVGINTNFIMSAVMGGISILILSWMIWQERRTQKTTSPAAVPQ